MHDLNPSEQAKVEVQEDQPAVLSRQHPRQGWEEQMRLMAERGDDKLLDADNLPPTQWDLEEWEWDEDDKADDDV